MHLSKRQLLLATLASLHAASHALTAFPYSNGRLGTAALTRTMTVQGSSRRYLDNPCTLTCNSKNVSRRRRSNLPMSRIQEDDEVNQGGGGGGLYKILNTNDQTVVGFVGILASVVMLYSENVLKGTGCGLPAGPYGLVGGLEGISYLIVTALGAYSLYANPKSGSGLFMPRGCIFRRIKSPGGVLIVAESLSYLTILFGIIILFLQVTNYGYIPNAVPMEGAMCK
mmetsp:Transcript_2800/g.3907  ORF Transcript_2800/g.3907 Transcript_2800/m.3907 type:complete len:226 (+) Transcript_2800:52-729(+)